MREWAVFVVALFGLVGCGRDLQIAQEFRQPPPDFAKASSARDDDEGGYVEHSEDLAGLAKADFAKVEPLLQRLATGDQPRTATLAQTLLYEHWLTLHDEKAAAAIRRQLKKTVEDKNAKGYSRNRAGEVLFASEWPGRDAWYLSLFHDATLRYVNDGMSLHFPLRYPVTADPDHWIPVMRKLLSDRDRAVHDSAVMCLAAFTLKSARKDALEPMLPWLNDSKWSSAWERLVLIQSIDDLGMREAVPGLISVLGQERDSEDRSWAAEALGHLKEKSAIPALRAAIGRESHSITRERIIQALDACGGISAEEAAKGVEAYLTLQLTEEGRRQWEKYRSYRGGEMQVEASIGGEIVQREKPPSGATVALLQKRTIELGSSNQPLAEQLQRVMASWPSGAADRATLAQIRNGEASAEVIGLALGRREDLRKTVNSELRDLEKAAGSRGAVAAVLLGDEAREWEILRNARDVEAQKMLLKSAAQVREKLPVDEVAKLCDANDHDLAEAAQNYLQMEDSAEARRLYLSRHKGEAVILGLRDTGDPGHSSFEAFDRLEAALRVEVKAGDGDEEIYALLTAGYWGDAGQLIVRKRGTGAELMFQEDEGRSYTRPLSVAEFDQLERYVRNRSVDNLGPLNQRVSDGMQVEYVHLARDGGRRVFMNNPGLGYSVRSQYSKLCQAFEGLMNGAGHFTLHYRAERALAGMEILLADERVGVAAVWSRGNDLRMLVYLNERAHTEAMRNCGRWQLNARAGLLPARKMSWVAYRDGRLDPVDRPVDFPDENPEGVVPEQIEKERADKGRREAVWALNRDGKTYRVAEIAKRSGVWEFAQGAAPRFVREGEFSGLVLSGDGKWAVVAEQQGNTWAKPNVVTRINLRTGVEIHIAIPQADRVMPVTYLAARDRVLVRRNRLPATDDGEPSGPETPEYWLVDASHGKAERLASGEFGPLEEQDARPLQAVSGKANVAWAAIYRERENVTEVGEYDLRRFVFKTVLRVPAMRFGSEDLWVDEVERKVYVSYRGQLVRASY